MLGCGLHSVPAKENPCCVLSVGKDAQFHANDYHVFLLWDSNEYCSRLASLIIGDECSGVSLMHMQIVLPILALVVQSILPSSSFSTYEFGNSCTVITEPIAAPQCHGAASVSVAIYASKLRKLDVFQRVRQTYASAPLHRSFSISDGTGFDASVFS